MVTATFIILNYTLLHSKSPIAFVMCLPPSVVYTRWRQTDLDWRQPIWVQQVGCLAHNNTHKTIWEHQIITLAIHSARTLTLGHSRINSIHHRGIVTSLPSHHFNALCSSTTLPHSTWHQACNQALVQPKDILDIGYSGKDTTSPKEVMVDLKCYPLSNSQDRSCHLQIHLKCLQHRLETIQSFRRQLPPLLQTDNFPAHLGDPPIILPTKQFQPARWTWTTLPHEYHMDVTRGPAEYWWWALRLPAA